MDTRRLKYFVAVAERLSVTAAARHLGIAQPPLSVQIRNLEAELGCDLFVRKNRRLTLTPAGAQLQVVAVEILERMDRAVCQIQDHAAGRIGELTLDYTESAFTEAVTRRLRKFRRRHRGLRLEVRARHHDSTGSLADALIAEFVAGELPAESVPLESAEVQIALPPKHRLADRTRLRATDLIGEAILLSPPGARTAAERIFAAFADQTGLALHVTTGPSTLTDRFWWVSLGLGIAVCSSEDRGSLDAVRILLAEPTPAVVTALVPNPNSRAAALPLLLEACRS